MAEKEKVLKRVVVHPKLYMRVDGHVQHVPRGTELTVTKAQCVALGGKLMDPSQVKKLDVTVKGGQIVEGSPEETEALKKLTTERDAAQEALTATATQLDAAQKEIKALKAAAKK